MKVFAVLALLVAVAYASSVPEVVYDGPTYELNMRRQSYCCSLSSGTGEPLIVVEESLPGEEEAERRRNESPPRCLNPDSPSLNPYLLSPWREARKHSLPTPQCTSGITASQVRRLSERGGEGSGPTPREAAFLATLSQAPAPQPGGRRHSVVTISKVPPTLFGRNRRESIAAFPAGAPRILPSRRDSTSSMGLPPSNSGSTHNLQLDIMDDIAEIKAARKVRLKTWKTSSGEKVCEVQPFEGNSSCKRYTQQQRRFSDFAAVSAPPPSGSIRRRASEMPKLPSTSHQASPPAAGIVCSNTDLISILSSLSSLTSSATEINRCGEDEKPSKDDTPGTSKSIEQRRKSLKSFRSNSFDVSILNIPENKQSNSSAKTPATPSNWFVKRHQPMSKKQSSEDNPPTAMTFEDEQSKVVKVLDPLSKPTKSSPVKEKSRHKVVWDGTSGTKVDAQVLGSAIEEFLTSQRGNEVVESGGNSTSIAKPAVSPNKPRSSPSKMASWFSGGNKDDEQTESCESSICSTLKDLFVNVK